jgi:hypothetical protein
MTFAMPSGAARKTIDRVLVVLVLTLLISVLINPVRHLHSERWAWIVPSAIGIAVGLLASFRYFLSQGTRTTRGGPIPEGIAFARGTLAAVFVFALSTFAAHELVLGLGAFLGGSEQSIHAQVVEVQKASRVVNRCRTFATFRLESEEMREICVDSRIRGPVVQGRLAEGDRVRLSVLVNSMGSWVTLVSITAPRSPNTSLERTRDR